MPLHADVMPCGPDDNSRMQRSLSQRLEDGPQVAEEVAELPTLAAGGCTSKSPNPVPVPGMHEGLVGCRAWADGAGPQLRDPDGESVEGNRLEHGCTLCSM